MNWTALVTAAAGAAVGGTVGLVVAAARNKPLENPILIGAALGAILVGAVAPKS